MPGIPHELIERDQWLVWRYEPAKKGNKPTKVPYDARRGCKSDPTHPQIWLSYQEATTKVATYSGLGFAFTPDDPFVGIDIDHCRDKATGFIEAWAQAIIAQLDSYTEISPSGTGVHIIVRGTAPHCGKAAITGTPGSIEMYDRRRYFTVTGKRVEGTPSTIEDRQDALNALYADYFSKDDTKDSTLEHHAHATHSELIERIRQSKQGEKFQRLMDGDTSMHSGDDSAADAALCALLAFWTKDPGQIEAIWGQSHLAKREKFNRDDYRKRTITAALKLVGDASPEKPIELTEIGNAQRFVLQHGEDVRYCFARKKWLVWDGTRWKKDETGAAIGKAKATIRALLNEAAEAHDTEEAKKIIAHWKKSASDRQIHAMLNLAQPDLAITPEQLNADPWLLNVRNGTIDLRTGLLRQHRREDFITKLADIEYDASAQCPRWQAFVSWAMCHDSDLIMFVQRAIGYAVTGSTREHVLFIPYGGGDNGKSTLFGVVQRMLGDYASSMRSDSLMVKYGGAGVPNDIADLHGQRFIVASEGEEGQRLAESLVKVLTGGDRIRARFLHAEFFDFEPTHTIFFFTNHKPTIKGTDNGIWRRIRLIPFDARVNEAEKDKELPEKLMKEAPGILNWILAGCRDWLEHGLSMPDAVKNATNAYRSEMDVLAAFLQDECEIASVATVKASELYEAYGKWCEDNGERKQTQRAFGVALSERGFQRYRGTNNTHRWRGVRLRLQDSDPYDHGSLAQTLASTGIEDVADTIVTHSDPSSDIFSYDKDNRKKTQNDGHLGHSEPNVSATIPVIEPKGQKHNGSLTHNGSLLNAKVSEESTRIRHTPPVAANTAPEREKAQASPTADVLPLCEYPSRIPCTKVATKTYTDKDGDTFFLCDAHYQHYRRADESVRAAKEVQP